MGKANSKALSAKQRAELKALAAVPEGQIDTRAIPEVKNWSGAKRGMLYRPIKQQLTLRIDADVLEWFRNRSSKGRGYQTNINSALREHIQRKMRQRKAG